MSFDHVVQRPSGWIAMNVFLLCLLFLYKPAETFAQDGRLVSAPTHYYICGENVHVRTRDMRQLPGAINGEAVEPTGESITGQGTLSGTVFLRVRFVSDQKYGWVAKQFICSDRGSLKPYPRPGETPTVPQVPVDPNHPANPKPSSAGAYCQVSWEEKPGTTDYTTYDAYLGQWYTKGDRDFSKTLQSDYAYQGRTLCQRAKFIKPCFDRVVRANNQAAREYRQWTQRAGLDPVLVFMAKAVQETKLGTLADDCQNGSCNGVGMAQIITALDEYGVELSLTDKRWQGITFNILTNLTYGVRVLAQKLPQANDLYELAYYYNGSSTASDYANKVVGYYQQLQACPL